jgi:RNA polymerase sigma-70 factor (ECF subfamily)
MARASLVLRWAGVLGARPRTRHRAPVRELHIRGAAHQKQLVPGAPTDLLSRASGGDAAAVKECLARFGPIVWGLARRLSPTHADAEDAVQDVFLDLWAHGHRYDPARGSPELFVAMVARRRLIDRRRQAARRPRTESIHPGAEGTDGAHVVELPGHDGGVESAAEAALAARAMGELRPEQREVLRLSVAEGLTHEEIAGRTGMPLGTVKAHARRGLLRIRRRLLGETVEEEGLEEDAR